MLAPLGTKIKIEGLVGDGTKPITIVRVRFPALRDKYIFLPRVLIGSLDRLCPYSSRGISRVERKQNSLFPVGAVIKCVVIPPS